MTDTKQDLMKRLETLATKKSQPFCYQCYRTAPTGRCTTCFTDDLMRETHDGVEYGVDWIIRALIRENLTPVNEDEAFEEFIRQCYPETTKIGWLEAYDTVSAIRELDPISWQCEQSSWLDTEVSEETLVTFDNGSTHYTTNDVENYLDEAEGCA